MGERPGDGGAPAPVEETPDRVEGAETPSVDVRPLPEQAPISTAAAANKGTATVTRALSRLGSGLIRRVTGPTRPLLSMVGRCLVS